MIEFIIAVSAGTLAVAFGLAVFQYVILPIGNGIGQLKELLDERRSRGSARS